VQQKFTVSRFCRLDKPKAQSDIRSSPALAPLFLAFFDLRCCASYGLECRIAPSAYPTYNTKTTPGVNVRAGTGFLPASGR
jgi:hypothetical protein